MAGLEAVGIVIMLTNCIPYIPAKTVPVVMQAPRGAHLIYIIVLFVTEEIVRLLITQYPPIHLHV
jgi:hypothetical protein